MRWASVLLIAMLAAMLLQGGAVTLGSGHHEAHAAAAPAEPRALSLRDQRASIRQRRGHELVPHFADRSA